MFPRQQSGMITRNPFISIASERRKLYNSLSSTVHSPLYERFRRSRPALHGGNESIILLISCIRYISTSLVHDDTAMICKMKDIP